jgi:hypothetical protein
MAAGARPASTRGMGRPHGACRGRGDPAHQHGPRRHPGRLRRTVLTARGEPRRADPG